MSVTEDMIAAYADGELKGEQKVAVEAALAAEPALARKVEAHLALKRRLATHYVPLAQEPVPDRLAALLGTDARQNESGGGDVFSFAAARQRRGLASVLRRWAPIAGPALAASLVLVIVQPWQGGVPDGYAEGDLAQALDTQLAASQSGDAATRILLSFEREGGNLCRAWRSAEAGGIACRDATGWKIERQFTLTEASRTDFRQAGSETELLAAAQEMAAGGALDAAGERAARESDWLP